MTIYAKIRGYFIENIDIQRRRVCRATRLRSGVDSTAIFAKDFSGLLLEKSAKTTRQPMPSAAPIRPAPLVSTQQGDRNIITQ